MSAPRPSFELRRAEVGPKWRILVTWATGETEYIGGFHSETAAADWIAKESDEWLSYRKTIYVDD
jgi:hypothetical protein